MMQKELPFDARKLARAENPRTSHAAAAGVRAFRTGHHAQILAVMACGADWTADEIAAKCCLDRHQVGRRLNELERHGLVRKTANQRDTGTGRLACCYEVAP